ncbi:MAG: hydrolase, partial [Firmicutes bacterium]|nr:hydrolase [Bacillota bacterium]
MNFFTSDCHFFHKNIIRYEDRPFRSVSEMNAALIANWNRKVGKNDHAYILGDLGFCSGEEMNGILAQLSGHKYLIKGNHDNFLFDKNFDKRNFVWIKDYYSLADGGKSVVLFHFPIAVWDKQHHGSLHLYGHIHSN